MRLRVHRILQRIILVHRYAVHGDQPQGLRLTVAQHCKIEVGDGRSIQHPPQLPFSGLHLDGGGRVVRVGNRHIIDGEIFRRFAEAGAGVGCVSIFVDQELPRHRFRFSRRRIGIDEVLIADNEHPLR